MHMQYVINALDYTGEHWFRPVIFEDRDKALNYAKTLQDHFKPQFRPTAVLMLDMYGTVQWKTGAATPANV